MSIDSASIRESAVSDYAAPPLRRGNSGLGKSNPSRTLSSGTTTENIVNISHWLTFRTTSIRRFQCYFIVALLLNIFFIIVEFLGLYVVLAEPRSPFVSTELALVFLSLFFSLLDTAAFVFLIYRRSKNLCVAAFLCMLTTDVIYSSQLALYTAKDSNENGFYVGFLFSTAALALQAFPLIITYRFGC